MRFLPPLAPPSLEKLDSADLDSTMRLTDEVIGTPLENMLQACPPSAILFARYEEYRLGKGVTADELNGLAAQIRRELGEERGKVAIRAIIGSVDSAIDAALGRGR